MGHRPTDLEYHQDKHRKTPWRYNKRSNRLFGNVKIKRNQYSNSWNLLR